MYIYIYIYLYIFIGLIRALMGYVNMAMAQAQNVSLGAGAVLEGGDDAARILALAAEFAGATRQRAEAQRSCDSQSPSRPVALAMAVQML